MTLRHVRPALLRMNILLLLIASSSISLMAMDYQKQIIPPNSLTPLPASAAASSIPDYQSVTPQPMSMFKVVPIQSAPIVAVQQSSVRPPIVYEYATRKPICTYTNTKFCLLCPMMCVLCCVKDSLCWPCDRNEDPPTCYPHMKKIYGTCSDIICGTFDDNDSDDDLPAWLRV